MKNKINWETILCEIVVVKTHDNTSIHPYACLAQTEREEEIIKLSAKIIMKPKNEREKNELHNNKTTSTNFIKEIF